MSSVAVLALGGCGGSSDDGAQQLAKQQELRAARAEAAQDARQGARISELERKLKRAGRTAPQPAPAAPPAESPEPEPEPVSSYESLSGTWEGEAVIEYESGKSDPFRQTIEITSLAEGEVSGYSEARQGSTTCHGPLVYEGVSAGWYRFSAEEQNVAECIDYSQVELQPGAGGDLDYRETTEVSVSTGILGRVG